MVREAADRDCNPFLSAVSVAEGDHDEWRKSQKVTCCAKRGGEVGARQVVWAGKATFAFQVRYDNDRGAIQQTQWEKYTFSMYDTTFLRFNKNVHM